MKKRIYIIFILLVKVASIIAQQKDFPKLTGPYLGQKPPGITPELFAPGISSKVQPEWVFCTEFSPEGKYFFYMSTEVLNKPARTNTYWVDAQIIYKRLPKE